MKNYTFNKPIGHIGNKDIWLIEIFISILIIIRLSSLILSIYLIILKKSNSNFKHNSNSIKTIKKSIVILNNIFTISSCFVIIWYFHPFGPSEVKINGIQKTCFFMLAIIILIPYIIDEINILTNSN